MLAVVLRFPLGVYHAQAQDDFARPEWPPHPVRLVAALLAAAHTRGVDVAAARSVLARLSAADPPVILAPRARDEVPASERDAPTDEPLVASLRGASRWAPRNHELSELRRDGVYPRELGRKRAEVHKVGVAIGDQSVAFSWPELELTADQLAVFEELVEDVAFLGT
ncbi:MAG: type I-U CRISPR-associated protein Cas5/Cas6, partial [Solirubrobacterales bacterium]|nr:type I-U CRISPR-associated protein Cas5/Cas6 [Solirubrobacterales bacterium]